MKIFRFVQIVFFIGLTILSNFINGNSPLNEKLLKKINNLKQVHKLFMLKVIILYFILLVLKSVYVVAFVIISIIHIQKFVFLIL